MHLVQLLLPLYDNEGQAFAPSLFADVRAELTDRFGGFTAYSRAPAVGVWDDDDDDAPPKRDDIVVHEVMSDTLDRAWWAAYRASLEARFRQDEIVIRAQAMVRL